MVSLEISGAGVVEYILHHPALEMFPAPNEFAVALLVEAIRSGGQDKPIVVTSDGMLLEGRARWAACAQLGTQPQVRIERAEPWLYVLTTRREQILAMPPPARAMLIGQVPAVHKSRGNTRRSYGEPPTRDALATLSELSPTTVGRAQKIRETATDELIALVADGAILIGTAERVALEEPYVQQRTVERVRAGENARKVAPPNPRPPEGKPRTSFSAAPVRDKHRYVRAAAIRALSDSLASLNLVLDAADALDPSITPEEAHQWICELSRNHTAYRRVRDLLNERKEQQL